MPPWLSKREAHKLLYRGNGRRIEIRTERVARACATNQPGERNIFSRGGRDFLMLVYTVRGSGIYRISGLTTKWYAL
jgi:hypothetical protein